MVGYFNTLIRYYLHMDPDQLSDQQWAQSIAQLKHIRQRIRHSLQDVMT